MVFFFGEVLVEFLDGIFAADVGRDGDDLAFDSFGIGFDYCVELVLCSTNDVDLGSVDSEGLCSHQANTTTATCRFLVVVLLLKYVERYVSHP